jgi:DNA-directed RNA polymerase specialized sigma24 family protein
VIEFSFVTTRWTHVLAAQRDSADAATALSELCAAYYTPVHAYIAHTAHDLGDPRDLTQDFFARLLTGKGLTGAKRGRGRFRAYLLGAVKHFLADTRDRQRAAKRGAQQEHLPITPATNVSPGLDIPAHDTPPADVWFDRQWGLAVLDRAVSALAAEHERPGRAVQFDLLKHWLAGDSGECSQAEAARRLGLTEGAVKVAIHRLRRRFRELVKAEIAHTVADEDEMRDELRYLIEVVR